MVSVVIVSSPCLIVIIPLKTRHFFIKSPGSAAMALINKPNDPVRTDSIIIFILQGESRDWGQSSDSPKTSQYRSHNSKPTLDSHFRALLETVLFINICVSYTVQKQISVPNQHLLVNLHIWHNI